MKLNDIAIIGKGNVATHLYNALKEKHRVSIIDPHTLSGISDNHEIIIIAVSDNAIKEVALKIAPSDAIIVHTAGSVPMDIFRNRFRNYGVFYPLQTFTKDVSLKYSDIPVFIEAPSENVAEKLRQLARSFTDNVSNVDSETRKKLHLAAVFACNFTNAMAMAASELLEDSGLEFNTLLPLLRQTFNKLEKVSPQEAQTGPAKRKNKEIINDHLNMLSDKKYLRNIYESVSEYILSY